MYTCLELKNYMHDTTISVWMNCMASRGEILDSKKEVKGDAQTNSLKINLKVIAKFIKVS